MASVSALDPIERHQQPERELRLGRGGTGHAFSYTTAASHLPAPDPHKLYLVTHLLYETRHGSILNMAPRRPRSDSTSIRPSISAEPSKPYAHLASHTTHISQSRILKTWRPLPVSSQDRIKALLLSVKHDSKARRRKPHFQRMHKNALKDALSDEDWEATVDDFVEKLVKRLPRMPFPATYSKATRASVRGGTAEEFSLEMLLSRNAALRSTMSGNVQSVKLLQAQIRREERALRRDREELKGLQDGVRSSRDAVGREPKGLHEIVAEMDRIQEERLGEGKVVRRDRGLQMADNDDDMMDTLIPTQATKRRKADKVVLTNEVLDNNPDLAPLVKQLKSHLTSMRGNVAGLKAVRQELGLAEEALRQFDVRVLGP